MKKYEFFNTENVTWEKSVMSKQGKKSKKGKSKNADQSYICHFFTVKNWNSNLKDRLIKLQKLKHFDHLVAVRQIQIDEKQTQFFSVSDLFPNFIALKTILSSEQSQQLLMSKIKYIAFHMVRALLKLEQSKLAHLNLTPSSVFIYSKSLQQINKNLKIVAKVGKMGYEVGDYAHYREYFHPDVVEEKVNPFLLAGGTNATFSYDAWSFSVLIYYLTKGQLPFLSKGKQYDISIAREFLSGKTNLLGKIENNNFLNNLISRCMNKNNLQFQSWNQVYNQFLKEGFMSKIELKPIKSIYESEIRVMYLFSQIFILVMKNLQIPFRDYWKNQNFKGFLWGFTNFCYFYHEIEFKRIFLPLCATFSTKFYEEISLSIKQEKHHSQTYRPSTYSSENKNFSSFLDVFIKNVIKAKMDIEKIKEEEREKSLLIFFKFLTEFLICLTKMQKLEKDQKSHREDIIAVVLESENFKSMTADVFHFTFVPNC